MNSTVKKTILICSVIASAFLLSCNNSQSKNLDMENHQHSHSDNNYACPMHPEVTGEKGDKCSKCGMNLELVTNDKTNNIEVKITSTPQKIEAGKPNELSFSITKDDKNVALDIVHEKKIHLLIVNEELTWFDHIHPEAQKNGNYTVTETFPYSGKYLLYTDFKASNSTTTVNKQEIDVAGNVAANPANTKNKWVSKVDDYKVTLVNGNDFKTNRAQHFDIFIEKDGKFITAKDLQPYLGAVAHVIVIGKTDKDFLHVHPTSNEKYPIHGETRFEKDGVYRMWVEFQINGIVHKADFTVDVADGNEIIESENHNQSGHQH